MSEVETDWWVLDVTVKKPGGVHSDVLWRGRNEHDLKGSDTGLLWNKEIRFRTNGRL